jgi:hypothetical protein
MSSQRVYLVVRPPCAAYIAITFESPLSCASPARSPLTYGRSWCPLWTPAYSARPPIAPDAWYNHLGGRPGVLGARLAGLSSVKFRLTTETEAEAHKWALSIYNGHIPRAHSEGLAAERGYAPGALGPSARNRAPWGGGSGRRRGGRSPW